MKTKGVQQLSEAHLKMMRKLMEGYPTEREKLNSLFFNGDNQPYKTVISKYFESEYNRTTVGNKHKKGTKTNSSARSFHGQTTIKVVYPRSGRVYNARVRTLKDLCIIEPIAPNTAYWVLERRHLDGDMVDLNKTPHIRQYHNKAGREFASNFR